jgi:Flp pilus assembly protein CpaB
MISRLTLSAVIFAIIGTASLAFAANVRHPAIDAPAAAKQVRVVQLERVVVVAKRLAPEAR